MPLGLAVQCKYFFYEKYLVSVPLDNFDMFGLEHK